MLGHKLLNADVIDESGVRSSIWRLRQEAGGGHACPASPGRSGAVSHTHHVNAGVEGQPPSQGGGLRAKVSPKVLLLELM